MGDFSSFFFEYVIINLFWTLSVFNLISVKSTENENFIFIGISACPWFEDDKDIVDACKICQDYWNSTRPKQVKN